jgi:hypothetical protein
MSPEGDEDKPGISLKAVLSAVMTDQLDESAVTAIQRLK